MSNTITANRIEASLIHECACLIDDATKGRRAQITWVISGELARAITAEIGSPRIARLAFRCAGFSPALGPTDEWITRHSVDYKRWPIVIDDVHDFGVVTRELDPSNVLGIDR